MSPKNLRGATAVNPGEVVVRRDQVCQPPISPELSVPKFDHGVTRTTME